MSRIPRFVVIATMSASVFATAAGASQGYAPAVAVASNHRAVALNDVDSGPEPDVVAAADAWGVSLDEATRQLALQEAMDSIDYQAFDAGFADILSTPGKDFKIHYYSSQEMTPGVSSALERAGLDGLTIHHRVPFSYAELRAAHDSLQNSTPT